LVALVNRDGMIRGLLNIDRENLSEAEVHQRLDLLSLTYQIILVKKSRVLQQKFEMRSDDRGYLSTIYVVE
jgi:hypothetical protein